MVVMLVSMMCLMRLVSSGVVRLMRERRHWARALSHPMREKMKVMAGSMLLAARMVVTSGRPRGR